MSNMFSWLSILHYLLVGRQTHHANLMQAKKVPKKKKKITSPNDDLKGCLKTWDCRSIASGPHKGGGGAYSTPYETPAARANRLTYIGFWPMTIKLNPSWKMDVSKSACIKLLYMAVLHSICVSSLITVIIHFCPCSKY